MMDPECGAAAKLRGITSAALTRLADTPRGRRGLTIGDALASAGEASFGFVMLSLPALITARASA
jgi:hypothetical protein